MRSNLFFYNKRGRLGDTVTYMRDGKAVTRAIPMQVANPKTERQVSVRVRFAAISKICRAFKVAVNIGYKFVRRPLELPRNVFIHDNWAAVTLDAGGMADIHHSALKVSDGPLPQVTFGQPDFTEPETVTVAYAGNTDQPGASATDDVYVMVYQPDLNQAVLSTDLYRNGGNAHVSVPTSWQGMQVHVYGFAASETECSESSYIGSGIIA